MSGDGLTVTLRPPVRFNCNRKSDDPDLSLIEQGWPEVQVKIQRRDEEDLV